MTSFAHVYATVRKLALLFRRDFAVARSYRAAFVLEVFQALLAAASFYFLSRFIESPKLERSLPQGTSYFPFVLVGIAFFDYLSVALHTFDESLREARQNGTLENLLVTQTSLPVILAGSSLYPFALMSLRTLIYLGWGAALFDFPVRDANWLGGLLILLEDQIRIGDGVTINGISGAVEEINLRTTILRGDNGAVHIISNDLINTLSNTTRGYAYYLFQATIAYGSDVDRALKVIGEAGAQLAADETFGPLILAPIEVMGIDRLGDRGPLIRARIRTLASKQDQVGWELNRRINLAFATEGIAFPPATAGRV